MKNLICLLSLPLIIVSNLVSGQIPTINSFSPESGPVGTSVTILGENFSSDVASNIVYFGSVRAVVNSASASQLNVVVPAGTTLQPITVSTAGLTAHSAKPYRLTFSSDGGYFGNPQFLYGSNAQVKWSTLADIDGDGKTDVIYVDEAMSLVNVFRNTSGETISWDSFAYPVIFSTSPGPYAVAAEDLNGDGLKEVIVTGVNGTVSVFQNISVPGYISFLPETSFETQPGPGALSIKDLNSDGKPDIAAACTNNFLDGYVSILENTTSAGVISFAPHVDLLAGSVGIWSVKLDDMDGDGMVDVVSTSGGTNSLSVFRTVDNDGPITLASFSSRVDYPTENYPAIMALGDFDLDGKTDVAVGNAGSNSISLFRNVSSPGTIDGSSFVSEVIGTPNPWNPTAGDFDGDGKTDLMVRNDVGDLQFFRNVSSVGSFAFIPHLTVPIGGAPLGIDLADINNDGRSDLVISNEVYNTIHVLQHMLPTPPEPQASFVSNTGFEVSWSPVPDVTSYRLDISKNEDFTEMLDGYGDREITPTTWPDIHLTVAGLKSNTNYFLRVRSVINGIATVNSPTLIVKTLHNPYQVSANLWTKVFGGPGEEEVQAMSSDEDGNVYIAGYFSETFPLGTTQLTSQGGRDLFIAKIDSHAKVVWARSIGGPDFENEISLNVFKGDLLVTAKFSGTIDVDPGPSAHTFTNEGNPYVEDSFFAKYNASNGRLVWARQLSDVATWSSSSIAANKAAIFIAGYFSGTTDFNPGPPTASLTSLGGQDIFLAKYTHNGNFVWAEQIGGYDNETPWGLLIDESDLYIHGSHGYTTDFDPKDGTTYLYEYGGFFGKYDGDTGKLKYVKHVGNGSVLALSKFRNNIYIAGDLFSVADLDPGVSESLVGSYDYPGPHGFVASFDARGGEFNWAEQIISTSFIGPRRILADMSGIYVSGYFMGSAAFSGGMSHERILSASQLGAFFANYELDGDLQWTKSLVEPGWAVSIASTLTRSGYYLAGLYAGTINFDPYKGKVLRSSTNGSNDIFVTKYRRDGFGGGGEFLAENDYENDMAFGNDNDPTCGLVLFPNPASEHLTIRLTEFFDGTVELRVVDAVGKTLIQPWIGSGEQTINISGLPSGLHVVKARQGAKIATSRFIKQQ